MASALLPIMWPRGNGRLGPLRRPGPLIGKRDTRSLRKDTPGEASAGDTTTALVTTGTQRAAALGWDRRREDSAPLRGHRRGWKASLLAPDPQRRVRAAADACRCHGVGRGRVVGGRPERRRRRAAHHAAAQRQPAPALRPRPGCAPSLRMYRGEGKPRPRPWPRRRPSGTGASAAGRPELRSPWCRLRPEGREIGQETSWNVQWFESSRSRPGSK